MIISQKKSLPLLKLNQTFSATTQTKFDRYCSFYLTVSEREVLIYIGKSYLFATGNRPLKSRMNWLSIKSIPLLISSIGSFYGVHFLFCKF